MSAQGLRFFSESSAALLVLLFQHHATSEMRGCLSPATASSGDVAALPDHHCCPCRCFWRRGRHRLAKRGGKSRRRPMRSSEPGQITPIPDLGASSVENSGVCAAEFCKWLHYLGFGRLMRIVAATDVDPFGTARIDSGCGMSQQVIFTGILNPLPSEPATLLSAKSAVVAGGWHRSGTAARRQAQGPRLCLP
jgi:hypothetical protein